MSCLFFSLPFSSRWFGSPCRPPSCRLLWPASFGIGLRHGLPRRASTPAAVGRDAPQTAVEALWSTPPTRMQPDCWDGSVLTAICGQPGREPRAPTRPAGSGSTLRELRLGPDPVPGILRWAARAGGEGLVVHDSWSVVRDSCKQPAASIPNAFCVGHGRRDGRITGCKPSRAKSIPVRQTDRQTRRQTDRQTASPSIWSSFFVKGWTWESPDGTGSSTRDPSTRFPSRCKLSPMDPRPGQPPCPSRASPCQPVVSCFRARDSLARLAAGPRPVGRPHPAHQ